MIQVALVGGAHIHTPNFIKQLNAHEQIAVKWVWDHDPARAQRRAEALSSQVAALPTIWSDPTIEAVIICAETQRHEALVLTAAAAGKHLFVEKPLGFETEDGYRMAQAIEEAGVLFQTGYFMRSDPIYLFLKAQIEAGHFGKITRVRHTNCHAGALQGWFDTEWRWMADLSQAGVGAFGDLGAHSLDLLLWWLGEVEQVTATINAATGRYEGCDEFGEGLIRFKSGSVGNLAAGWVDVTHPITTQISGTEGHAYVANGQLFFQSDHVPKADGQTAWTELPTPRPHAFDLFLAALTGQADVPLVTAQEAAQRSAMMIAMYQAARVQRWVQLG